MSSRVATAAAALVTVLVLGGCAATTFDTSETTAVLDAPTTVPFTPAGAPDELLAQLDGELATLSERIVDNDGADAALARVDAVWAEARPSVAEERPELLAGFDAVIGLATTAVERRRPADADKARLNLTTLLTAYGE